MDKGLIAFLSMVLAYLSNGVLLACGLISHHTSNLLEMATIVFFSIVACVFYLQDNFLVREKNDKNDNKK
jgi:hypothetical protein